MADRAPAEAAGCRVVGAGRGGLDGSGRAAGGINRGTAGAAAAPPTARPIGPLAPLSAYSSRWGRRPTAAFRPGHASPRDPGRGSRRHLRSRPDPPAGGGGPTKMAATAARPRPHHGARLPPHPGRSQARRLVPDRGRARLCRSTAGAARALVPRAPPHPAVRAGGEATAENIRRAAAGTTRTRRRWPGVRSADGPLRGRPGVSPGPRRSTPPWRPPVADELQAERVPGRRGRPRPRGSNPAAAA